MFLLKFIMVLALTVCAITGLSPEEKEKIYRQNGCKEGECEIITTERQPAVNNAKLPMQLTVSVAVANLSSEKKEEIYHQMGCKKGECEIFTIDIQPKKENDNVNHHLVRRSSVKNLCDSITEKVPFTDDVPDAPQTLRHQILTQKIIETRCKVEGQKCLESSEYDRRTYICKTIISPITMSFATETNEKFPVTSTVNTGCSCSIEYS